MPKSFSDCSADEILGFPREKTVFFFPVGPLEDHGPHLPVGLDLMEARHLCRQAAERLERELSGWTGVVMPDAPLGIEGDTTRFALVVRAHVLRDWLVDACRGLKRPGFRHFVCFSGHLGPKQLTAIEEAGKILGRRPFLSWFTALLGPQFAANRPPLVSASSGLITAAQVKKTPWMPDPEEHGGARDTAVALALEPSRVAGSYETLPPKKREPSFLARLLLRLQKQRDGYWGEPSRASRESGEKVLSGALDEIFPKLRAVWEGANPNALFRSWYSIIPWHKSFFKAWVISLALAALMLAWVYMNFRVLIGP